MNDRPRPARPPTTSAPVGPIGNDIANMVAALLHPDAGMVEFTDVGGIRSRRTAPGGDPRRTVVGRWADDRVVFAGLTAGGLDPERVIAVVADRTGSWGASAAAGIAVESRRLLRDALLRYLGLPTPEERRTPGALVCGVWLDRLLALDPTEAGTPDDWSAAAKLHPTSGRDRSPEGLVRAGRAVAQRGWSSLLEASTGTNDPEIGWFDTGARARLLLAGRPAVRAQLRNLVTRRPTITSRLVQDVVERTLG